MGRPHQRDSLYGLSPELSARLGRMAEAEGRDPALVLADAVLERWVRHATRGKLTPSEW